MKLARDIVRSMAAAVAITLAIPGSTEAQRADDVPPFAGGALMLGAQGFARPPITSGVAGGYAYVPLRSFLVGVQGASTFADDARSHADYVLGTVGYAQSRAVAWQVYPFVGIGRSSVRTRPGEDHAGIAGGAGLAADGRLGEARAGMLLGGRVGYVGRSLNDDESFAYAVVSIGIAGRFRAPGPGAVTLDPRRP